MSRPMIAGLLTVAALVPTACNRSAERAPPLPLIDEIEVAKDGVDDIAVSDDWNWAASIRPYGAALAYDRKADRVDLITGYVPEKGLGAGHRRIDFRPGTSIVGVPSADERAVVYWDFAQGRVVFQHDPTADRIESIFFSSDGEQVAYVDRRGRVLFARCGVAAPQAVYQSNTLVYHVTFLSEDRAAVFATEFEVTVDTGVGGECTPRVQMNGTTFPEFQAFSGNRLAVLHHGDEVRIVDGMTWKEVRHTQLPGDYNTVCPISESIMALVTSSEWDAAAEDWMSWLEVWNLDRRQCLARAKVSAKGRCRLSLAADGQTLIAAFPRLAKVQFYDVSRFR